MENQPDAETDRHSLPVLPVIALSDDSDEDTSQEEVPATSWNELSIIERVGLNSVEMSETDLEAAFTQIAIAFRCDQYTLKQRLQAEEHARNLAEENVQLELSRGRETLETLKGLCLDSKRSRILQRLELSLDILAGTVERISNTAEVLGAVHQEARVSRAVELMVAHVENLRKRYDQQEAELDEAKRTIAQQNSCRITSDPRASPDPDENDRNDRKKSSLQHCRRRVSISLISTPIQEKLKRDSKKQEASCQSSTMSSESGCSAFTKDDGFVADDRPPDPEETPPEAPAAQPPPETPPVPTESVPLKPLAPRKIPHKSSPLDTLRQRHKSKAALSKKKVDKDRKSANVYQQNSTDSYGSLWRQRPVALWLYRCRWALICLYLLVLLCVVMLTYVLWNLHDDKDDAL